MRLNRPVVFQFRKDFIGQLFAKLNTPLIEAENIPDNSLHENFMLVHGNQAAQYSRG